MIAHRNQLEPQVWKTILHRPNNPEPTLCPTTPLLRSKIAFSAVVSLRKHHVSLVCDGASPKLWLIA